MIHSHSHTRQVESDRELNDSDHNDQWKFSFRKVPQKGVGVQMAHAGDSTVNNSTSIKQKSMRFAKLRHKVQWVASNDDNDTDNDNANDKHALDHASHRNKMKKKKKKTRTCASNDNNNINKNS